jgi:hypothetical protein
MTETNDANPETNAANGETTPPAAETNPPAGEMTTPPILDGAAAEAAAAAEPTPELTVTELTPEQPSTDEQPPTDLPIESAAELPATDETSAPEHDRVFKRLAANNAAGNIPTGLRIMTGEFRLSAAESEMLARLYSAADAERVQLNRQQDLFGWMLRTLAATL